MDNFPHCPLIFSTPLLKYLLKYIRQFLETKPTFTEKYFREFAAFRVKTVQNGFTICNYLLCCYACSKKRKTRSEKNLLFLCKIEDKRKVKSRITQRSKGGEISEGIFILPKEYIERRHGEPFKFLFLPKMGLLGSQAVLEKKVQF